MKYTAAVSTALCAIGFIQPATATIGQLGRVGKDIVNTIGDIVNHVNGKRVIKRGDGLVERQGPPPGVPEFEYERCYNDLSGLTIAVTGDQSNVQFSGVPPTCMNLATVLVGDPVNGPYALPCGSDCLTYQDLTPAQYDELQNILS